MSGFVILLRKELKEQWRTYRMPIMGAIFLVSGIASPLLAFYTPELIEQFGGNGEVQIIFPEPTSRDALSQLVGNLGLVALLSAILLAMGSVAAEKVNGTAALVLTKPVSRMAFLAAKFAALTATLAVGTILAGIAAYLYTAVLFEELPVGGFTASIGVLLLSYLVYMTITMLGSTLLNSALPAAAIGIGVWILTLVLGPIPGIGGLMPTSLSNPAIQLALGEGVTDLIGPLLFSVGLIVTALAFSWLSFRRQAL